MKNSRNLNNHDEICIISFKSTEINIELDSFMYRNFAHFANSCSLALNIMTKPFLFGGFLSWLLKDQKQ